MADITSNLDLHWKFNDGSGSSAADSSGNGRTGTLSNAPSWTTGQWGCSAITFNGSNSNVYYTPYTVPTTGTLSFWFKPGRAFNSGVNEVIFNLGGSTNFHANHWVDNHLYIGFIQGGGGDFRVNVTLDSNNWTQGVWQQYVLTWVSGGATQFYRNNTQVGATVNGTNSTLATNTFRVGTIDAQLNGISGDLQDIRVYSRVLSANDIAALYAYTGAATGIPPTNQYLRFGF